MEEEQSPKTEELSRRERRKLFREQQKKEQIQTQASRGMGKWVAILAIVALLGWGAYSLYKNSTKPLPGKEVAEMGRDHVTDIFGVEYNSNPPTSGPHFAVWAKPGVYDRFISDGYLIHSMEHGYVIIWYDCSKISTSGLIRSALAHDEPTQESSESGQLLMHLKVQLSEGMSWFTPKNPPQVELEFPDSFRSDSCKSLVSELSGIAKVAQRVIVAPKINMDSVVAVTAWGRIDKMDSVDKTRIEEFIKAFHNRGPEQTTE
jgi:hypothetical protein